MSRYEPEIPVRLIHVLSRHEHNISYIITSSKDLLSRTFYLWTGILKGYDTAIRKDFQIV